jgi:hypothetical protein
MITYEKLKISEISTDDGKYDDKKKKYVKYKTPIISKKVIHEYDYTNLEELACEVRHAVMRNPYKEIEITFKAKIEY